MNVKSPELLRIGKVIRNFREQSGYSQDKFAFEVGLGRSYYGSLERGEINPSVLTLIKIAVALDLELRVLIPEDLVLGRKAR